jgi:hypothetical protein
MIGFTQLPNWLIEAMPQMPASTFQVAIVIARQTIGYSDGNGGRKEWDRLSLTQFVKATGLSRQGVLNAIDAGLGKWFERRETGQWFEYKLVNSVDQLDQSNQLTSQLSRPEVVNPVDQQLVNSVDPQKKENIKTEKGESAPPPPAELPPHYKNLLAQANGHPRDYRRREKADADEYTDAAWQLGIAPEQFTDRINRLASVVGKRSYLDAAPNDDRTLNEIKDGALTLARLGYHTEADYRQLAESFAQSNQWMDRPIPTLKQFVDHAAAVKDGVIGKDAKTRSRLPKPGPGGFYDFPTMAAMKDAVGQNPDLRSRVTVKGTKV